MVVPRSFRITLLFTGSIGLLMIYYSNYFENRILAVRKVFTTNPFPDTRTIVAEPSPYPGYVIHHPNCKMPASDPWNPSLKQYLSKPLSVQCSRLPPLTYIEQQDGFSNVLRINEDAIKMYKGKANHVLKCSYRVIKRVNLSPRAYNKSADNLYKLSKYVEFTEQVLLSKDTEFIHVKCNRIREKKPIYSSVHAVVPLLPEVVDKFSKKTTKYNVVILGLDSLSKLNLRRSMPMTMKYFKDTNWIELRGYNKVGENTFPNLMAILTGETVDQLDECWDNRTKKSDDCFMLWSEYRRKGYITLYAEDTPNMSTFNYHRMGFVEKPTDYYMRPFMVAGHDMLPLKKVHGMPVCMGPRLAVEHVLNYGKRFLRAFKNASHFSLLWLNSLSHNDVNVPKALDVGVHRFLQDLSQLGTYNNSFVFVLSDHGARFGRFRESFFGFLEERLPFMFIWTPKWFRERHPARYRSLLVNQDRLTSPFDVYVTLRQLVDEEQVPEPVSLGCPKCKGLFEEQSLNRSCEEASVPLEWCLCAKFEAVSWKTTVVIKIIEYLRARIINTTKETISSAGVDPALCSNWTFRRVARVHEMIPMRGEQYSLTNTSEAVLKRQEDEKGGSNGKIFVIVLEFFPGRTKFESMVQLNGSGGNDGFVILQYPKRLDGIYKTSRCVDDAYLKFFCYCRSDKSKGHS